MQVIGGGGGVSLGRDPRARAASPSHGEGARQLRVG